MDVAAVIVTRGDVDLAPILDSLPPEWEKVVWDNSRRPADLAVYGRYAAIAEAEAELIYVQDDDCVLAPDSIHELLEAALCGADDEVDYITANMPEAFRAHYTDSCLVGFGAIFHRDLPRRAFAKFAAHQYASHDDGTWLVNSIPGFDRTCDVVFTALTQAILLDVPYTNLPCATDPARAMYLQPGHVGERARMLELAREAR